MLAGVTDSPNWVDGRSTSLTYRFLSAMQGALGIGANLKKWTPEDFATARELIEEYKLIRTMVQQGALYRLASPRDGSNFSSTESVSEDGRSAVVFAFLHSQQMRYPFPTIQLRGLKPNMVCSIRALSGNLPKDIRHGLRRVLDASWYPPRINRRLFRAGGPSPCRTELESSCAAQHPSRRGSRPRWAGNELPALTALGVYRWERQI